MTVQSIRALRAFGAVSLLLFGLLLGACGQGSTASNEVSMTAGEFSTTSITIKAGQTVQFSDPAGMGGVHTICIGADGACDISGKGPKDLQSPGFTINAGDPAKGITFDTPGTYKVTCSIHPAMNLTVVVQ
jgi:plastocyanin